MHRLLILFYLLQSLAARSQEYYLVVGTYTGSGSKGIYVYHFDGVSGALKWVSNTDGNITNPSYFTIAPGGKYIYACTDTRTEQEGSVSAFSLNSDGTLKFINKQSAGGANPVYIATDNSGKWLVNGNYTSGSLSVFPVNDNGSIQPARQIIQHYGAGLNKERQEKAHVHATVFAPQQDYLFVPDLGADKIMIYKFNAQEAKPLQPAPTPYVTATTGSGPRHFTFHPNGKYAYCIEELSGTVEAYSYHDGVIDPIQRISSYKAREEEYNSADIHISPDGKFLYTANRNLENDIAIFAINETTGKLTLKGFQTTLGEIPRNFIIDPSGNFLLVANQESGSIIVFRRDMKTGLLKNTGNKIKVPEPSCLQLIKL